MLPPWSVDLSFVSALFVAGVPAALAVDITEPTSAATSMIVGPPVSAPIPTPVNARGFSTPDYNISSGTCYFQAGQEADSSYIPCGNTAFGTFACCERLSNCLGHSACWSGDGTTYFAGCTDPSYNDPVCPNKGPYDDQQWTGLVYCNGTSDEWTLCDESSEDSQTVVGPGASCWCPTETASRIIAFTAPVSLENLISLPFSTGSSMSYFDGYTPTNTVPTSAAASTSSTTSSPWTTSSSPSTSRGTTSGQMSLTSSAPSVKATIQPTSGLTTGAKVGVGIGAGIGGCTLLAILCCIPLYIRRHKRRQSITQDATIRPRSQALAFEKDPPDELDPRSPAWSGHKSELPADERNSASVVSPVSTQDAWTCPTSAEVEGSMPTYQSMGGLRPQAMGDDGLAYNPYRKPEAPPIGVKGILEADVAAQAAKRPESDVYEMPAQVPGYHGR